MTSYEDPIGGINKDDISSSHGFLHQRAAEIAINATVQLLEDIRVATGNVAFLRYETIDLWYFSNIKGRNLLCYYYHKWFIFMHCSPRFLKLCNSFMRNRLKITPLLTDDEHWANYCISSAFSLSQIDGPESDLSSGFCV